MDPNETLACIRTLMRVLREDPPNSEEVDSLLTHFEALDQWLTRGGFLPHAWQRPYPLRPRGGERVDMIGDYERKQFDALGPPDPAGAHLPEHDDA